MINIKLLLNNYQLLNEKYVYFLVEYKRISLHKFKNPVKLKL